MNISSLHKIFLSSNGVNTDSRTIKKGEIYFALKGENFDGNEYAEKALDSGAKYSIIDKPSYKKSNNYILVDNVLKTLQGLASYHRSKFNIPVIGITGTNGKTTTKELIYTVLSKKYKTNATIGNLNNHIGVPLTLLKINSNTEIAIVEMGANHLGEIDFLCNISKPNFGIITNIGKAHLEGFGSFEGIIETKKELYNYITNNNNLLFVNYDDKLLSSLLNTKKIISYGTNNKADTKGKITDSTPFVSFEFNESRIINTKLIGNYNFYNALAAASIGKHFGVNTEDIELALASYSPENMRSQLMKTKINRIIIDAYNANPTSMENAIINFKNINSENKVLIIGDMLELGKYSENEHYEIIKLIKELGFKNVYLVGNEFYKTESNYNKFMTASDLIKYVKTNRIENSFILLKGSRGIKLETLIEYL